MGWRWGWGGPWPGRGPFSYLPPWMRPGWIFGRGACWLFLAPYIWGWRRYPHWLPTWWYYALWQYPWTYYTPYYIPWTYYTPWWYYSWW